jgi:2-amino-4-hydroxy-6-hydroxymethyldihydropteridine diphosphokinase
MSEHPSNTFAGANRAYLSLGSNIEPEQNLPAAVRELSSFGRVLAVSSVWESAPLANPAEGLKSSGHAESFSRGAGANFLNAALLLETDLSAEGLYDEAIAIVEGRLGRVRDPRDKYAPRTIDVDLSLFNHDVLALGAHRIPDPDIVKRSFVAVPLAELDPDYRHPVTGQTLGEIAAALQSSLTLRADVRLPYAN